MTRHLILALIALAGLAVVQFITTTPQPPAQAQAQGPTYKYLFPYVPYQGPGACHAYPIQPTQIDPVLLQPPYQPGGVITPTVASGNPYYHLLSIKAVGLKPCQQPFCSYTERITVITDQCATPTGVRLKLISYLVLPPEVYYVEIGTEPDFVFGHGYHGWDNYEFDENGQVIPRDRRSGFEAYVDLGTSETYYSETFALTYQRVTAP